MLKIDYKGYKISQGSSKHIAIFKDGKMMFHANCDIELSEQGLKQMLDWYLDLLEKVDVIEEPKKIERILLPSFEEFKNMSAAERYLVTAKEYDLLNELIDIVNEMKGVE